MVLMQIVLRVVDGVLAVRHSVGWLLVAAAKVGLLLLLIACVLVCAADTCAGFGGLATSHVSLLVLIAV